MNATMTLSSKRSAAYQRQTHAEARQSILQRLVRLVESGADPLTTLRMELHDAATEVSRASAEVAQLDREENRRRGLEARKRELLQSTDPTSAQRLRIINLRLQKVSA